MYALAVEIHRIAVAELRRAVYPLTPGQCVIDMDHSLIDRRNRGLAIGAVNAVGRNRAALPVAVGGKVGADGILL